MPNATLTFSLPEESEEFRAACEGEARGIAIFKLLEHLRREIKHGEGLEERLKAFRDVRSEFYEILESEGVSVE